MRENWKILVTYKTPEDKIESVMKPIRAPNWLTAQTRAQQAFVASTYGTEFKFVKAEAQFE